VTNTNYVLYLLATIYLSHEYKNVLIPLSPPRAPLNLSGLDDSQYRWVDEGMEDRGIRGSSLDGLPTKDEETKSKSEASQARCLTSAKSQRYSLSFHQVQGSKGEAWRATHKYQWHRVQA
jgi:hypothetical protein